MLVLVIDDHAKYFRLCLLSHLEQDAPGKQPTCIICARKCFLGMVFVAAAAAVMWEEWAKCLSAW